MNKPAFFLAFSNVQGAELESLKKEELAITQSLSPLRSYNLIDLASQGATTTEDLFNGITAFQGNLAVFHYAGHSDQTVLFLEDKQGNATGLANLLGREDNLKLVFLNGCNNKEQVAILFRAGVKAVIATSRPINDGRAFIFANQFYKALANGRAIDDAFQDAVARLEMENMVVHQEVQMHRNLDFEGEDIEHDALPWGLYVREGEEEVLQWKIPGPKLQSEKAAKVIADHEMQIRTINALEHKSKITHNDLAQMEIRGLKNTWKLLNTILEKLREALFLESDVLRKMKIEQQIEEREIMSQTIKDKIVKLEAELN